MVLDVVAAGQIAQLEEQAQGLRAGKVQMGLRLAAAEARHRVQYGDKATVVGKLHSELEAMHSAKNRHRGLHEEAVQRLQAAGEELQVAEMPPPSIFPTDCSSSSPGFRPPPPLPTCRSLRLVAPTNNILVWRARKPSTSALSPTIGALVPLGKVIVGGVVCYQILHVRPFEMPNIPIPQSRAEQHFDATLRLKSTAISPRLLLLYTAFKMYMSI